MKNSPKSHMFIAFPEGWLLSDRIRNLILFFTFFPAVVLGTWGFLLYHPPGVSTTFTNALYHTAQLFILHAPHFFDQIPWQLEFARVLAAASTFLVLVNTVLLLTHHERMQVKLTKMKDHIIICGLGKWGMALVELYHLKNMPIVAIDNHPDTDVVERLFSLNIPLIVGDATRSQILKEARIEYAGKLFTLSPDDITNCTIAMMGYSIPCKRARSCYIHINEAELRNALQLNHPVDPDDKKQKLSFIDNYETEAINLLTTELPLDHDGIPPGDPRKVHLIILGYGQMGRTIAVKAAQTGQFANFKCMRISVIDRKADINHKELLFHHQYIEEVADFRFYQQEIHSPETRKLLEKWCKKPGMLVSIVVCFNNQPAALDTVFHLMPVFNKPNVRVAVRVSDNNNFEFLLKGSGPGITKNIKIKPFGGNQILHRLVDSESDQNEKFAKDIHNAYVNLILKSPENDPEELNKKMRSDEMQDWDVLGEAYKESNRQQALHMNFKIRAAGCEIVDWSDERTAIEKFENPLYEVLAKMEHNRWVAERKVNNWKYGKPSNKPEKINENLVDWEFLTKKVKGYDYQTIDNMPVLLKSVGKKIVKRRP